MLVPLFFAVHILPVVNVVAGYNLHQYQYADDALLHVIAVRLIINWT